MLILCLPTAFYLISSNTLALALLATENLRRGFLKPLEETPSEGTPLTTKCSCFFDQVHNYVYCFIGVVTRKIDKQVHVTWK